MARKKEKEENVPVTTQNPQVEAAQDLQKKIKETSMLINDILVKAGFDLAVVHQIRTNPDLRQEEIMHDIILKPRKNV